MKIDRRHFLAAGPSALAMPSILFAAEDRGTAYIKARVWTGGAKSPMETAIAIAGSRSAAAGQKTGRELIAREKGGRIVRDANGEPTGIIIDGAKKLVQRVMPPPSDSAVDQMMRIGIQHGLSNGVTQAHSMGLAWDVHRVLLRLRAKGETDMRFFSYVPLADWETMPAKAQR